MTWAVRWWSLGPAVLLLPVAALLPAVLGPVFRTPQVVVATGQGVPGPTALLSGLLVALAVVATLPEPAPALSAVAARRVRRWRLLRVLGLVTLAVLLLALAAPGHLEAAASCVAALTGEALLTARALWDEVAWALPVLHAGLTLTFGVDRAGVPHVWAWILRPDPTPGDLALSVLVLGVGTALWLARPPGARGW